MKRAPKIPAKKSPAGVRAVSILDSAIRAAYDMARGADPRPAHVFEIVTDQWVQQSERSPGGSPMWRQVSLYFATITDVPLVGHLDALNRMEDRERYPDAKIVTLRHLCTITAPKVDA